MVQAVALVVDFECGAVVVRESHRCDRGFVNPCRAADLVSFFVGEAQKPSGTACYRAFYADGTEDVAQRGPTTRCDGFQP